MSQVALHGKRLIVGICIASLSTAFGCTRVVERPAVIKETQVVERPAPIVKEKETVIVR